MLRGSESILAGWCEVAQGRQDTLHAQSPGYAMLLVKEFCGMYDSCHWNLWWFFGEFAVVPRGIQQSGPCGTGDCRDRGRCVGGRT
jgi:hypothetical protein